MRTSVIYGIAALLVGFVCHVAWTVFVSLPPRTEGIAVREEIVDERITASSSLQKPAEESRIESHDSQVEIMPPLLGGENLEGLPREFALNDDSNTRASVSLPPPDPFEDAQIVARELTDARLTFLLGGKDLDDQSKELLLRSIGKIKNLPENTMLEIRGHTDAEGSAQGNLKISMKRAESVRDFLVASGVPAEKLRSVGYGSTHPVAANNTDAGRAANRRIEFLIRKLQ